MSVSWVIRDKTTKKVVMETFNPQRVKALNTGKYEAVPIARYLQELNRNIKASNENQNTVSRADTV